LHVFVQHVLDIQTLALNEECPNFYHLLWAYEYKWP
jgi:hypothetical protein